MKYKLVIFDIDGTLIDSESTGVLSLIKTIKELVGKEEPYETAYKFFGISSAEVSAYYDYPDPIEFSERWEENFVEMSSMIKPFEGAEEILKAVKASGTRTGIVTARNHYEFDKDVHLKPMLKYIDDIVTADETPHHKPHPEPVTYCIEQASKALGEKIDPQECIYLGDTVYDWQCGHGAGCRFALADWRNRGMQGIAADARFTNAQEALKILE